MRARGLQLAQHGDDLRGRGCTRKRRSGSHHHSTQQVRRAWPLEQSEVWANSSRPAGSCCSCPGPRTPPRLIRCSPATHRQLGLQGLQVARVGRHHLGADLLGDLRPPHAAAHATRILPRMPIHLVFPHGTAQAQRARCWGKRARGGRCCGRRRWSRAVRKEQAGKTSGKRGAAPALASLLLGAGRAVAYCLVSRAEDACCLPATQQLAWGQRAPTSPRRCTRRGRCARRAPRPAASRSARGSPRRRARRAAASWLQ